MSGHFLSLHPVVQIAVVIAVAYLIGIFIKKLPM